jgi:predicted ATPase
LKTKRIVIIGGPGSGKTSLINHLEDRGYSCLPEISRQVILDAQKEGIAQLFLENPILFSEKLLEGRLKQFKEAHTYTEEYLFYDRGMPDVTAYMDFIDSHYPPNFDEICFENRYDAIYLLPPWKTIYTQDNERYETYEQAEKIYDFLLKGYQKYGYTVNHVPTGTLNAREQFIINHLKDSF